MSYTNLIALWPKTKRYESVLELRNAHGSAPHIWTSLCEKYFDNKYLWLTGSWSGDDRKVDDIAHDKTKPVVERLMIAMTFSYCYIKKADYLRAADDIQAFFELHPVHPNYENHWPAIEAFFRSNPKYPAIGFHWTDCSDNLFRGRSKGRGYTGPDWTKCWDLYQGFDSMIASEQEVAGV